MNRLLFIVLIWCTGFLSCTDDLSTVKPVSVSPEPPSVSSRSLNDRVIVANRASSSISVIDASSNMLLGTYDMPDGGEPMYAVHIPQAKAVFVGDRANSRVVAFDEDDFSVKGMVPAGQGVFHMWAAPNGSQLWVNNDIDNTTTVINPISMKVKGTAETPPDLVALGGKPHDVFFDPQKQFVYVSVLGVSGDNDYVVKYKAGTFAEVDRVAVGKDPHLFADDINDLLYVPCQNSDAIYVVHRATMDIETVIQFPGAHGVFMPESGGSLYVANITGSQIGTFETAGNSQVGMALTTPFPVPHNLAINASEDKLFITHSGATADKVSIYSLNPLPALVTSLTVGVNPFGLVYYQY